MTKVMRYDAKRDSNEAEIICALHQVGAKVMQLDEFDLLVGFRDKLFMLEVKTKTGRLNAKQARLFRDWAGHIWIVRSVDEALRRIGAI